MTDPSFYPWIDPVMFYIGDFGFRWYSFAYILGFVLGYWCIKIFAGISFNQEQNIASGKTMEDLLNIGVFATIFGGRFGYVLFYNLKYYASNPLEALQVWHGGMSFHGALIALTISLFIYAKVKKLSFLHLTDLFCLAAPIGIFFGRIANFINGELWGRVDDCAICIPFLTSGTDMPRHPSQLYEAFFEGLLLFAILASLAYFKKSLLKKGLTSAMFLFFYGFFRFFIEFFREPDNQIGFVFQSLSLGQLLCFAMIISGILVYIFSKKQGLRKENFHL